MQTSRGPGESTHTVSRSRCPESLSTAARTGRRSLIDVMCLTLPVVSRRRSRPVRGCLDTPRELCHSFGRSDPYDLLEIAVALSPAPAETDKTMLRAGRLGVLGI